MTRNKWDTVVVGAGAAGSIAAVIAAQNGQSVLLLEKNEKIGKKIYITGKGRCNLTNASDIEDLLANIPRNPKFMYGALRSFSSHQLMAFFEEAGCSVKVERGNRVFPVSEKSSDIIKALERKLAETGVTVRKSTVCTALLLAEMDPADGERKEKVEGVLLEKGEKVLAERVILATGGLSYPATGSTGDGLKWAKKTGHQITELRPALVPMETVEADFSSVSLLLKNIKLTMKQGKKILFQQQGELQFTGFGISGALALSASSYYPEKGEAEIEVDCKPALTKEQLEQRVLREVAKDAKQTVREALASFFPAEMLLPVLLRSRIPLQKRACELTKKEREAFIRHLKSLQFHIKGLRSWKEAVITRGGVSVKEVNPKTMESRRIKNLFFAGEMLDVDGLTGGYNLQIAFSTGYVAGMQGGAQ